MRRRAISFVALLTLAACPNRQNVPCTDNSNCDLSAGGLCVAGSGDDKWCAYPDSDCPDGFRFSTLDVGDGLSGQCTDSGGLPPDGPPSTCTPLIAFQRSDGLFVIKPDGTGIDSRATGNLESNAVWSPDGKRILMERGDNANKDLWVVNVDGTGLANLTQGAAGNDQLGAWSPDGTRIAFVSHRDGTSDDLWVMDSDGGNARKIDIKAPSRPSWSPDGTKIAYGSFKNVRFQVYVVDAGSTGVNAVNVSNSSFPDTEAVWSPDGTKIAFMGNRGAVGSTIFIMNADGSNQQALVASLQVNFGPAWAPNSQRIAFVGSTDGSQLDVYTIKPDRTNLVNLTSGISDDDEQPTWSADGTQLSIRSHRDGNYEIYRINDDGTGPARMTTTPLSSEAAPAWSPCR